MISRFKRIKVEVTQDDIDRGVRDMPRFCPVARACQRTLGVEEHDLAVIEADTIRYRGSLIDLPTTAERNIKRYDRGNPMKPFNFYLEIER